MDLVAQWARIRGWYERQVPRRPLQVCLGPTASAAAASRSLQELFRSGLLASHQHPIFSRQDLLAVVENCRTDSEDNCFILVGCGAAIDLGAVFGGGGAKCLVHVIDSARPYALSNLRLTGPEIQLWNGPEAADDATSFFRHHADVEEGRKRTRDDSGEEAVPMVDWRDPLAVTTELEGLYLSSRSCGESEAQTVWRLAADLRQNDLSFLWNAAVGLTDLYLRALLDVNRYHAELAIVQEGLSLLKAQKGQGWGSAARSPLQDAADPNVAQFCQVDLVERYEHRPLLLRHWTLWASIWHEPVLAAKLQTFHNQRGDAALRTLLAHAGVSFDEANLPWATISRQRREFILREVLKRLGDLIGTEHPLSVKVLCRKVGFGAECSAFDACRLFDAELSRPHRSSDRHTVTLRADQGEEVSRADRKRRQYWRAVDVLDAPPHSRTFIDAVAAAVSMRKAISDTSAAVLGRIAGIVSLRTISHVLLTSTQRRELHDFVRVFAFAEHIAPAHLELLRSQSQEQTAGSRARPKQRPILVRGISEDVAEGDSTGGGGATSHSDAFYDTLLYFPRPMPAWQDLPALYEFNATIAEFNRTESTVVDGTLRPAVVTNHLDGCCVSVKGLEASQRFVEALHLRLYRRHK